MKRTTAYLFSLPFTLFTVFQSFAQFSVQITVNSANISTTCTDPIGPPDPLWAINIANGGWLVYPKTGSCFTALPNVQFSQNYQCVANIPPTVQVCFRVFENDPNIFVPCDLSMSCLAETCLNIPVPPNGSQSFTIQLPPGLPSGGSANLTIASSGFPGGLNDALCDAVDAGVLLSGTTVGDADTSLFNNYCGTNFNEPDPWFFGVPWVNNRAVWFKFTTGPNPGSHIKVVAKSDPSNFGDPVNLQVAVFNSSDNSCTGTFDFVAQNHEPVNWDEILYLICPDPNTTYYIMVDAVSNTPPEVEGYFGIEITEMGVLPASDLRCQAENLGAVPLGGAISTPGLRSNSCSTNAEFAPSSAFTVQKSVWFAFTPPPTGHVFLQGISDTADDPVDLQISVYGSSTNSCSGVFSEVYSQYTAGDLDETLELHCLDPNQTYYIQVDGASGNLATGIFSLTVTDAGDETPVTNQTVTLCAGESLTVGTSLYSTSGVYVDTLHLQGGCDSIVHTNLTVLPELNLNFSIVQQGVGLGNTNGQAQVAPSGGAGGYSAVWSDGQTSFLATGLVGGNNYCVEVTDANGCMVDTCFDMPYYIHFQTNLIPDTLACFGDQDGSLRLTVFAGVPPYQFTWQNSANTISGSGVINFDNELITLENLPAGTYSFLISDINFDTTVTAEIVQPAPLDAPATLVTDAGCFAACDGSIQLNITGGTAPYQYNWSNGGNSSLHSNLCAGTYQVTVTDANACTATFSYDIGQPAEFIAIASEVQPVSCYQGSDGIATVATNGQPAGFLWSTNETAATISNLSGGTYTVTVTNADGCTATSTVSVSTPSAPVSVGIDLTKAILCNGEKNGSLTANVTGPGAQFSYQWSNGAATSSVQNLGAGSYDVTVSNEKGCQATATFVLDEPEEIEVSFYTNQLTCFDELDGGIVTVIGVSGGVPPYQFSADGFSFTPDTLIDGYTAGTHSFFVSDAGGCVREFSATVEGPTELFVEAGEDKTIELGNDVTLKAVANQFDVTYQWEPAEWLSCADCPDPVAMPLETAIFQVIVTDVFGCTAFDEVQVEVIKVRHVFVPNAFSPDGDGINDEFMPYGGNDVAQIKSFKIFDRQGNQVFSADNFQPGDPGNAWNGAFRGKLMKPAVFVWFAEIEFLDGEVELFRGDVVLVR